MTAIDVHDIHVRRFTVPSQARYKCRLVNDIHTKKLQFLAMRLGIESETSCNSVYWCTQNFILLYNVFSYGIIQKTIILQETMNYKKIIYIPSL